MNWDDIIENILYTAVFLLGILLGLLIKEMIL